MKGHRAKGVGRRARGIGLRAKGIGRGAKGMEVVAWGEGVEVRKAERSKQKKS